jgi:putative addiction module component (TIGR02574 family)
VISVKQEVFTMPVSAKTLSAQAMQLPPEERLALVDELLDTLDVPDAALDSLWAQEAQSRLAAYRRGEVQALALSDVIAKYQATVKAI